MTFRAIAVFAVLALSAAAAEPGPRLTSIRIEPQGRTLAGAGASQQLLVIAEFSDGAERDLTDRAAWKLSDPSVARIDNDARLLALADGALTVIATVDGHSARTPVRIEHAQVQRPFSFGRDIAGIFTRRGCNGTTCHGSVKGRGGFKLSANALNPREDYEWITKGGGYQVLIDAPLGPRVPRVDLQQPSKSLLLQKPSMVVAHGGGLKLPKDSEDYRKILEWAEKGAPFGDESRAQVTSLEVTPRLIAFPASGRHRLLVTAHMADGSREDFTREVEYQVNNTEVASVTGTGVVSGIKSGETAVLVRAAGQTASAVVGVIGTSASAYAEVPRSNFIDDSIFSKLRKFHIEPSNLSRDDEFLRRVCLDLTGTLPPPARVRQFLASKDRNKRDKLVEALMATPEFVDYWTFRFSDLFRVSVVANGRSLKWSEMYSQWLRDSIATNKPYDQIARERVAPEGYDGPSRHYLPNTVIAPAADMSGEQVRVFLGRRLDCAQCHNHPYENWTQNQFWGVAAFFNRVFILSNTLTDSVIFDHPVGEDLGSADVRGSIKLYHPRTKAEVKPAFLDGTVVPPSDHVNPRRAFARWITSHPYFAEAAVNRVWSWFFGRGLVEPVDDFRSTNPSTHPELLEKLAADFREHGHDLRRLMRLIVTSQAYQLSGVPNETNKDDQINYSHAIPRPLDAEVLLDAISDVTVVPEVFSTSVSDAPAASAGQAPLGTRAINLHEADAYYSRFLELYGRPNRLTVPDRNTKASLGQALDMLAGPAYNEKLMAKGSRLSRLLESGTPDGKLIEEFYLAALGRFPSREETADLLKLIERKDGREEALKDFIWALISSREFAENH
ncbi:MAG: hypothetical protein JWO48_255 [Bryobacterales bacterium]|nr:hypothetical protein [Bryobacterales bacterium]